MDDAKVSEKAFFKSGDNVASALLEQVKYGDQSRYLRKLSLSQIKKLKGKDMLAIYDKVRSVQCDLHYCGTLPVEKVIGTIRQHLPLERTTVACNSPYYRELKQYDRPTVFFIDMPDMAQASFTAMSRGDPVDDKASRHASRLFSVYFGGDMSSLMFQEIRNSVLLHTGQAVVTSCRTMHIKGLPDLLRRCCPLKATRRWMRWAYWIR
ncbi:MAG: hypothetical protein ACLR6J_16020 [Parabacteroides merdae]